MRLLHVGILHYLTLPFTEQLRALYLGDNDFETLPPEIGELRSLQVVNLTNSLIIFMCTVKFILKMWLCLNSKKITSPMVFERVDNAIH